VSTLVVLGAGDLGGAVARQAAERAAVRRVVVVDDAADVARGKALDIRQSGAILGAAVDVVGTNDLGTVVGASVVVLADRHATPAAEYQGDDALRLLGEVRALNPRALLVCAGAAHLDTVERMVHERDADAALIVGSAPEALRSALVALASLESRSAPRDISLMLIGRPPALAVAMWNDASIGGRRAADVLDPPAITRLERRLPYLWPPGPLTLACAAVRLVDLATTHGAGTPSVFLVPAGPEGVRPRGVALPATVRATGVAAIWPALSPRDRTRLDSVLARP
jgi:hypothetical protein